MANTSTLSDPTFVTRDATNGIGVSALDARLGVGGLADPSSASTFGFATGVFPGSSSGSTILDCRVVQASSANMTVQVSPGSYQVGRSNLGAYLGAVTGSTSVTVGGSNGSNPRIDYVVLRVREPTVDGTVTASVTPIVLPGTAAANPSEATAAAQVLDGDLLLAAVTVRAGTTSILQSDITDKRMFVKARGGIGVKSATDTTAGSYPGDRRWNLATSQDEVWTSNAWVPIATPGEWTSFTPSLFYGGSGAPGTVGTTALNLGNGPQYIGRYLQIGKILYVIYVFVWGTRPYNGGTGPINTLLPAGITVRNEQHLHSSLYTSDGNGNLRSWLGDAFVRANTNVLWPQFTATPTDARLGQYRVASQQGAANGGTPHDPSVANYFPEGGALWISGVLETT